MLELDPAEVIELLLACVLHVTKGVEESKRSLGTDFFGEVACLEGSGGRSSLGRGKGRGGGEGGGDDSELHV